MAAVIRGKLSKDFARAYEDTADLASLDALLPELALPRMPGDGSGEGENYEANQEFKHMFSPGRPIRWMQSEFLRRIALDEIRNDDVLRVKRMLAALQERDSLLKRKVDFLKPAVPHLRAVGISVQPVRNPSDVGSQSAAGAATNPLDEQTRARDEAHARWLEVAGDTYLPAVCKGLATSKPPPGTPWEHPKRLIDAEAGLSALFECLSAEERRLIEAAGISQGDGRKSIHSAYDLP